MITHHNLMWLETDGGCPIIIPADRSPLWEGIGNDADVNSHYLRACAADSDVVILDVEPLGTVIVLGEEPSGTAILHSSSETTVVCRWNYGPDTLDIMEVWKRTIATESAGISVGVVRTTGDFVLFDSAVSPKRDRDADILAVKANAGAYTIEYWRNIALNRWDLTFVRLRRSS